MAGFVRGDVVIYQFPFSGESAYKKRPCLVLHSWPLGESEDSLLCLITSRLTADVNQMRLEISDFEWGSLPVEPSYIRPLYMFSPGRNLISDVRGRVKPELLEKVLSSIRLHLT